MFLSTHLLVKNCVRSFFFFVENCFDGKVFRLILFCRKIILARKFFLLKICLVKKSFLVKKCYGRIFCQFERIIFCPKKFQYENCLRSKKDLFAFIFVEIFLVENFVICFGRKIFQQKHVCSRCFCQKFMFKFFYNKSL